MPKFANQLVLEETFFDKFFLKTNFSTYVALAYIFLKLVSKLLVF